ncbi:MAG: phosphoribosylanthranilate isomerase [Gammaproteobacteria bacterium]
MSVFVKICGCRTREQVEAAVEAGADGLGFVFAPSPRQVTPERARELCESLPAHVQRIAVMHHPEAAEWQAVQAVFRPDCLQTDADDFMGLTVDPAIRGLPVYRDIDGLDEEAVAVQPLALFEAGASGQGQRADWERAARLAARTELILAGGLNPDNVAVAISQVKPWGVDVSSGVERQRGVKDLALIKAFVAAAKAE